MAGLYHTMGLSVIRRRKWVSHLQSTLLVIDGSYLTFSESGYAAAWS